MPNTMPIEGQKINRIAAMMAVSNMGQTVDVDRVLDWKPSERWGNSPTQEVCDLAGHLMETDEHEDIFAEEAIGWAKQINDAGGLTAFAAQFPHHADTIRRLQEA